MDKKLARLIWLLELFKQQHVVMYEHYRVQTGCSLRTFRRDVDVLKRAGLRCTQRYCRPLRKSLPGLEYHSFDVRIGEGRDAA